MNSVFNLKTEFQDSRLHLRKNERDLGARQHDRRTLHDQEDHLPPHEGRLGKTILKFHLSTFLNG